MYSFISKLIILVSLTPRTYNTKHIALNWIVYIRPTMCSQEHKNKEEIKRVVNPQQLIIQIINLIIRRIQQEEENLYVILIKTDTETESDEDAEDDELPPLI